MTWLAHFVFLYLAVWGLSSQRAYAQDDAWFPDYISGEADDTEDKETVEAEGIDVVDPNRKVYSVHMNVGYEGIQILDRGQGVTSGLQSNLLMRVEQRSRFSNNLYFETGPVYSLWTGKDSFEGENGKNLKLTTTVTLIALRLAVGMQFNFFQDTQATKKALEEAFYGLNFYTGLNYEFAPYGQQLTKEDGGGFKRDLSLDSAHRIGASLQALFPIYSGLKLGAGASFFFGTFRILGDKYVQTTYSGSTLTASALWEF